MTGNKRFISKDESIINVVTDELVNASSEEGAKIIVDWLNELSDKYAEQRKENYDLLDGIAFYEEENASLSERISNLECENELLKRSDNITDLETEVMRLKTENKELKEENEQLISDLKDENQKLKEELFFFVDVANTASSSNWERDMEIDCQKLFNCSYREAEEKYNGFYCGWWDK